MSTSVSDFDKFAAAIALTESHDNPRSWGDQGLAVGRWQMHPAFVDEWWPDGLGVDWSWDRLFRAALLRFYEVKFVAGVTIDQVAMEFHLGEQAVKRGDWDKDYAARFEAFLNPAVKP